MIEIGEFTFSAETAKWITIEDVTIGQRRFPNDIKRQRERLLGMAAMRRELGDETARAADNLAWIMRKQAD